MARADRVVDSQARGRAREEQIEERNAALIRHTARERGFDELHRQKCRRVVDFMECFARSREFGFLADSLPPRLGKEDLLQELALKRWTQTEGIENRFAYLMTAARNYCSSAFRGSYHDRRVSYPDRESERADFEPSYDPRNTDTHNFDLHGLMCRCLSDTRRDIVERAVIGGESQVAIARSMGVCSKTIGRTVTEALNTLRGQSEVRELALSVAPA